MNRYSVEEYLGLIGERIKLYRINKGWKQTDLSDKSGVSSRSISRLEQGSPIEFGSLIKILMALDLDENLQLLIPDQKRRPSYYLEKKPKQRVRKVKQNNAGFKWGDEK